MSDDHAKRVAEIEAMTKDYVEVFEPPKSALVSVDLGALVEAMVNLQPGGPNFVGSIDIGAVMRDLFPLI